MNRILDKNKIPFVKDITEANVSCFDEVIYLIKEGQNNRQTAVTNMNEARIGVFTRNNFGNFSTPLAVTVSFKFKFPRKTSRHRRS
jgi:hypothetical protein